MPMSRAIYFAWLLTGGLLISSVGCSDHSLESEVSGRVQLDDVPIGPGTVVFAPAGGKNPAIGAIDANGNYSLKTSRTVGLDPGNYRVAVSVREVPANVQLGDRLPPGRLLHSEKYESIETSGLEFEVKPGNNTIDIELLSE